MRTPRELVLDAQARFEAAGLHFGHGTDSARDEAVFIVFHELGLAFDASAEALDTAADRDAVRAVEQLISERLRTRRPAAYLTRSMWFGQREFYVDERVLVPRSPIAELVLDHFAPWIGATEVRRVLDVGTGSGCLAIVAALEFPCAMVDATDRSADALAVARVNRKRHAVERRVRLFEADLFPPRASRYDVIVSNPPYVAEDAYADLPEEYLSEPREALVGGRDGLDLVRRIIDGAAQHLTVGGLLVLEVGAMWRAFDAAFPQLAVTWVELERGGEGIAVIERNALA